MTAPSAPTSPASVPPAQPPPGAAPPGDPPGGPPFQSALEDSARTAHAEGHHQSHPGGRRPATADVQAAVGLAAAGAPPVQAATAPEATGGSPIAKPLASTSATASDAPATTGTPATKGTADEASGTPGAQAGAAAKTALPAGGTPAVEDPPALPGSIEPSSAGAATGAAAGAAATSATQDASQLSQAGPQLGAPPASTPGPIAPTASGAPAAQSANPTTAPHSAAPSLQNPLPDPLRAAAHDGRGLTAEKAVESAPAVSLPPSASGAAAHANPDEPGSSALSGLTAPAPPSAPAGVAVSLTALSGAEGSPAPAGAGAAAAGYGVDLQHAIEAVHATIELATRQGVTQARIALRPEELGEIRIHLTQSASGLVARVTADSPAAAQALTEGRAELRSSLNALGLTTLHLDTGAFQSGEQGREGHTPQHSAGFGPAHRMGAGEDDADPSATTSVPTSQTPLARGALVDVLA